MAKSQSKSGIINGDSILIGDLHEFREGDLVNVEIRKKEGGGSFKVINHSFPEVGSLSIRLFGYAAKIHDWLEDNGDIQILSETPHLGVASSIFPEFRHTRLDYIYLNLFFIDKLLLNSSKYNFKISSSKKYNIGGSQFKLSGAEIMQAWSLLLNVGHMRETFYAESVLKIAFKSNWEKVYDIFRNKWSKKLAEEYMEDSDYHFHFLLSLIAIEDLPRNDRRFKPFAALLATYTSSKIKGLTSNLSEFHQLNYYRRFYRAIRHLSYLSLDSMYASCPFELRLAKLISSLPETINLYLDNNMILMDKVQSLSFWLSNTYYCSPQMVHTMLSNKDSLRRRFDKKLKGAVSIGQVKSSIKGWRQNTKKVTIDHEAKWLHVQRLPVRPNDSVGKEKINKLFPWEHNLKSKGFMLSVTNSGNSHAYYMDFFAKKAHSPFEVLPIIVEYYLFSEIDKIFNADSYKYIPEKTEASFQNRWRIVRDMISERLYCFTKTFFSLLAPELSNVQFILSQQTGMGWIYSFSKEDFNNDIKMYKETILPRYENHVSSDEFKIRKAEFDFMSSYIKKNLSRWEHCFVFTGNIDVFQPEYGTKTDIDGLGILIKPNKMRIVLFQHKDTISGSITQSKKWFFKKILPLLPKMKSHYRINGKYKEGIIVSVDFEIS